jgi:branched-chain amino acid transport system ATP-binding protein
MTVLENLLVGGASAPTKVERARRLEFVSELFPKLRTRRSQLAGTMSGGEQQMVAIARGIMAGPRMLLLDETSLGLAPVVVDEIFDTIVKLVASSKLTILLVEQNTELALRMTTYAYVLEHGHVALEGHSKDLLCDDRVRKAYLGI